MARPRTTSDDRSRSDGGPRDGRAGVDWHTVRTASMAKTTRKVAPAPRSLKARRAPRPARVGTSRHLPEVSAVVPLVRRVLTLQEAERRRIARDIHDDLGQQVTALRLKLEWLASRPCGDEEIRGCVRAVQEAAERLDQHIDFLLRDLRPAGLDELGLPAVLRQTVADWSETFGIAATFRAVGVTAVRLPHEVETQAFRIVQEALNNVHKHAAATRVKVALERRKGRTVLTVADNGVGLGASPASVLPNGHRRGLGLLGMRERAMAIGGQLEIATTRGTGTTVTLLFP